MAVAGAIGLTTEFLIFLGVLAASPSSYHESGAVDGHLFQWLHEPSWHVTVASVPIAPSFFEDLGNAYLAVTALQAVFYSLVAYFVIQRFRKRSISTQ
jgi:hypothetical protein